MNYECHITVHTANAVQATAVAEELHWKTSEIARDPVLGDKNFFYLTSHASDFRVMYTRMDEAVALLKHYGAPVLREKIELIMHDKRHT